MHRSHTARSRPAPSRVARSGLTLVELLVALGVLTVGALALAGSSSALLHADSLARRATDAAAVVSARAESVVASGCRASSGTRIAGPLSESWHVWVADSVCLLADSVRSEGRPLLTMTTVVPSEP